MTVGPGWEETRFESGAYGPEDRSGLRAQLSNDSMTISVEPVRYERDGHRERIVLLGEDRDLERGATAVVDGDPAQTTAFATHVEYRPGDRVRETVYTVTRHAGDALAAATWLTADTDTDWEMERNVRLHRGQATARTDVVVSDDDALRALFREAPDRCVFSGKPTRSHQIHLPFRYVAVLRHRKRTARGVLRVPSSIDGLVGAVSHEEWVERSLADLDCSAPVARNGPGQYVLDSAVEEAIAGSDAAAFACRWLGQS